MFTRSVLTLLALLLSLFGNSSGLFLSAKAADVFLTQADSEPTLFNLSTRARVRDGAGIMIGGFIIQGEGPKRILIRARGPSLADAGVSDAMIDPTLRLFAGSTAIGYNDNWKSDQQTEIEATGRAPTYDQEAALIATLDPGPYTVHIRDSQDRHGVAIFEVIGIDEEPNARLFNISTRAQVETGDDVAIGGFIIHGDAPKQVLIRARGPSMAEAGVPGALPDPTLQLFSGSTQIATNDNWQDSFQYAEIQATRRAPPHELEAALIATLDPGAYTAIVRGGGNSTGIGIVEVIAVEEEVEVRLAAFGRGRVTSDRGNLLMDSELDAAAQKSSTIFSPDEDPITLTATPIPETRILGWQGCDWVSTDLTQCEVDLHADRQITVDFGYREAQIVDSFIDLSLADVIWTDDILDVTVDPQDTDLLNRMSAAGLDTFVAGLADKGPFLRRVLSAQYLNDNRWQLTTEEAALDQVVLQGTGTLNRKLTHGDLAAEPISSAFSAQSAAHSGVRLVPSNDPKDTTFVLQFGKTIPPDGMLYPHEAETISDEFTWEQDGAKITLNGEVAVEIEVETVVSYRFFAGLEYFKLIPNVSVDPKLTLTVEGKIETPEDDDGNDKFRIKLASLSFPGITFLVGLVPVSITPEVGIYLGVNGNLISTLTTSVSYNMTARAGVVYNDGDWIEVKSLNDAWKFDKPTIESEAEVKGYVSVDPVLIINKLTGPGLSLETFIKAKATLGQDPNCTGALDYGLSGGVGSSFIWEVKGADTVLGQFIGLDKLEFKFEIATWEEKIYGGVLNSCGANPPVLVLQGNNLVKTIPQSTNDILSISYLLTNDGDTDMPWSIEYLEDGVVTVSPTSGNLPPGDSTQVDVSVYTNQLSLGNYNNLLNFNNDYHGGIGKSHLGSTDRTITVEVVPDYFPAPQLTKAERYLADTVKIDWTFDNSANLLHGFRIYYTQGDPEMLDNWIKITDVDRGDRNITLQNLPTKKIYVTVEAYGSNPDLQTAYSEYMEVKSDAGGNLEDGLVAHYPLNNNADDIIGNQNAQSFGKIQYVLGIHGKAASFDGNSYLRVQNFDLTVNDFTVSTWLFAEDLPSWYRYALAAHPGEGGINKGDRNIGLSLGSTGTFTAILTTYNEEECGQSHPRDCPQGHIDPNRWYHVVFLRKGNTQELYFDGQLIESLPYTQDAFVVENGLLEIGAPNFWDGGWSSNGREQAKWKGKIDDIRIYNRALSEEEVQQLYMLKDKGMCPGLDLIFEPNPVTSPEYTPGQTYPWKWWFTYKVRNSSTQSAKIIGFQNCPNDPNNCSYQGDEFESWFNGCDLPASDTLQPGETKCDTAWWHSQSINVSNTFPYMIWYKDELGNTCKSESYVTLQP